MPEVIMQGLMDYIIRRLGSWLKNKRRILRKHRVDHYHDGKHMMCLVCAKIQMLNELIAEVEEGKLKR